MLERTTRVEVLIELEGAPGGGEDEFDRSTEQLRRRLRELDVEDVRRAEADHPGDDDALVVHLAPVLPALHDVVHTVRAWLSNNPDRVASLVIDGDRLAVRGDAAEDERELIRSWTERHSPTEL